MASREEERDRLREAREEKQADADARQRRRMLAVYSGAGFVAILVIVGVVLAVSSGGGGGASGDAHVSLQSGQTNGIALDERVGTAPSKAKQLDLAQAARAAGCVVRAKLPIEGRSHLPLEAPTPTYKTDPPTSGNHVEPPYQQADGAYAE